MKNRIIIILIFLVSVTLDQISKYIVQTKMTLYQSITISDNFFHITYILNKGAAFGLFSNSSESFRTPFFIAVSIIAISGLLYFFIAFAKHAQSNSPYSYFKRCSGKPYR